MFVEAIKSVLPFVRPVHVIYKIYGQDLIHHSAATLFFVNDCGDAITCRHVVEIIMTGMAEHDNYLSFKRERDSLDTGLTNERGLSRLEEKFKMEKNRSITHFKHLFIGCCMNPKSVEMKPHEKYDIAVVKFRNYDKRLYTSNARFLNDESEIQPGKSLCRIGFPFSNFDNFQYHADDDSISFNEKGITDSVAFPSDGIITRLGEDGKSQSEIEMSTLGFEGQSGGPLFDNTGKVYGMQAWYEDKYLGGFSQEEQIFHRWLHLGKCVHVNKIKEFLVKEDVEFHTA